MKNFFLSTIFTGKKLDIVYEQGASGTVVLLEGLYPVAPQSTDHFADELLGAPVDNV